MPYRKETQCHIIRLGYLHPTLGNRSPCGYDVVDNKHMASFHLTRLKERKRAMDIRRTV